MLGHRLRRWPIIKPALVQRVLLLGSDGAREVVMYCFSLWLGFWSDGLLTQDIVWDACTTRLPG